MLDVIGVLQLAGFLATPQQAGMNARCRNPAAVETGDQAAMVPGKRRLPDRQFTPPRLHIPPSRLVGLQNRDDLSVTIAEHRCANVWHTGSALIGNAVKDFDAAELGVYEKTGM